MKAVLLVGGEGTRLRPLTLDLPKQILPIAGQTMLERGLSALKRAGVDRLVLSLGYQPDAFIQAFPNGVACGIPLSYAVEPTPLGTGGAIRFAAQEAGMTGEAIMVHNGDIISTMDLAALQRFHASTGAAATIALTSVEDPSAFGVVVAASDGRVESFVEKPPRGTAPTNLVNAGTYILEPEVMAQIPLGRSVSIERDIFPILAAQGTLFAMHCGGYWIDAGTPEKYLQANRDVLVEKSGLPPFEGATPIGPLSDGVWATAALDGAVGSVMKNVTLQATVVAEGVKIIESAIGRNVAIAAEASIKRSVILDGVKIGRGAVIEDSIIGRNVLVGDSARITGCSVIGADIVIDGGSTLHALKIPDGQQDPARIESKRGIA